jgi:hypothetical protein
MSALSTPVPKLFMATPEDNCEAAEHSLLMSSLTPFRLPFASFGQPPIAIRMLS